MAISAILLYFTWVDCAAQDREWNTSPVLLNLSCFVLWFFMALRDVSVGSDTKQYCYGFEQISKAKWFEIFSAPVYGVGGGYKLLFEPGYRLFNWLVGLLSDSDQAITIASSSAIILLLYWLIQKRSLHPIFSVWLYLTLGIFQTEMNMARNAIAILICYHALEFVKKKKPVPFTCAVLIAMTFHYSAILYLPVFWLVNYARLTKKVVIRLLSIAVIITLTYSLTRDYIVRVVPFQFRGYFYADTKRYESLLVGAMHVALILFVIVFMNEKTRSQILHNQAVGTWMFLLDILFFCIGFDLSYAARVAALFGPYLILYIPNLIERGITQQKKKMVISSLVLLCGVQYLARLCIDNIGGTMPYLFFWDQFW